ncbi:hypothetical protein AVEN_133726-1 [Araneus ventricosus]|uniref:Gustatory receptor n=1 Tax=Araneus ventricosus TaxID=182803 RepID=A0A4Y2B7N6_ARAVE|nr:hypothetical protein AVEN_133726-1 [Araneus ventricosus]
MMFMKNSVGELRESNKKRNKKVHRCAWLACHSPVKSSELVANSNDGESPDLVFDVLWFMGVNLKVKKTKTYCEKITRNFVCFLYLLGLAYSFSIRMRAFAVENRGTMIITEMLAFICCIFLWISLNMQRMKITNINIHGNGTATGNQMYSMFNNKSSRKQKWINLISLLTICSPVFASAISMLISKAAGEDVSKYLTFLALGFHLNVGSYYKYIILFVLRSYDLCICFVSSQMTCLLFSILSYNVSLRIKETETQLGSNAKDVSVMYSSGKALKSYKRIQKLILDLESAISLPLFYAMAFLLCELFALMSNSIHLVRQSTSLASLSIVLCAILTTGFHAILLIFRVASVEESYQSLIRAFVYLPEDNLNPPYVKELLQMLKLLAFHDQLYVTAWGMFPIRRGFFLTIVGTLATYGVLLVQFT